MSYHEHQIEKLYWSIGELAERLNVAPTCIRFWEQYFGIDTYKNRRGHRKYRCDDVEKISEIHRLLKIELYTLEGAKKKLQHG